MDIISVPKAAGYPFFASLSGCREGLGIVDRFRVSGALQMALHFNSRSAGSYAARRRYMIISSRVGSAEASVQETHRTRSGNTH
jgi:hypothetical protein